MYGIGGERDLTEHTLDHLSGYRGSRPVRIGNGALDQRQHDVWGMLLDAMATHERRGGQVSLEDGTGLAALVDTAIERSFRARPGHLGDARRPEALRRVQGDVLGRRRPRRTHRSCPRRSRARGTVGRGRRRDQGRDPAQGRRRSRRLHSALRHHRPRRIRAADPHHGLPARRRRAGASHGLAVADELTQDGLVLRYRVDKADDGLSNDAEGTFTICSFWLVSASRSSVSSTAPCTLREAPLASPGHSCSTPRRSTPPTQHLGNFPQAFTHLASISRLHPNGRKGEGDPLMGVGIGLMPLALPATGRGDPLQHRKSTPDIDSLCVPDGQVRDVS